MPCRGCPARNSFAWQGKSSQKLRVLFITGNPEMVRQKDLTSADRMLSKPYGQADLLSALGSFEHCLIPAHHHTGSGAAFMRSMAKRLVTFRSGTAAINRR